MKKIDKLMLNSFAGPFIITFLVVVFILLNINMLKYFDDIIGKDLAWGVLGQLLFYFAVFTVPTAMPLAVLLSSLITFGNLGEHFELTAIKGAGISLLRVLIPIFFFVVGLTAIAFYANNYLVPKAALEAYSLLYDIKQKKPALELREGSFYNGIPDISIKVNKKFPKDDAALKEVIIYDHRKNDGNKEVTVADSGRMYTILNERYLKLELFNGYNYNEGTSNEREITGKRKGTVESMSRSKFSKTQVVFDLSSFQFERTDKKWFQGNRIMRNLKQLNSDLDSLNQEVLTQQMNYYINKPSYFLYFIKEDSVILPPEVYQFKQRRDSMMRISTRKREVAREEKIEKVKVDTLVAQAPKKIVPPARTFKPKPSISRRQNLPVSKPIKNPSLPVVIAKKPKVTDSIISANIDSIYNVKPSLEILQMASNKVRQVKSEVLNHNTSVENYQNEVRVFEIQWHQILSNSFACIAMFLIGAPLGAIIKRGGLGVPFLVSIFFFIVFYLLSMQGQKWAKNGSMSVITGVWEADVILLIIGLFFLRQARVDARLFDSDFYMVVADRLKGWLSQKRIKRSKD